MSLPSTFSSLTGAWKGTKQLWLMPGAPAKTSTAMATVSVAASGKFLHVGYTWQEETLQQGILIMGVEGDNKTVAATWIDSWHNGDRIMNCKGGLTAAGAFSVRANYPAPPGPDWGWRIEVEPVDAARWWLRMFNITPQGEEAKAVEIEFKRT